MNVRYLILTIALLPFRSYTAEIAHKKEDRTLKHQKSTPRPRENSLKKKESSLKPLKEHQKKESKAVLLDKPKSSLPKELSISKNTAPVVTHITSMITPIITFNGKTQSLYEWFKDSEKNKFGHTRVVAAQYKNYETSFTNVGQVNRVEKAANLREIIAAKCALYISNVEKYQSIDYGALVLREGLNNGDQSTIDYTTNLFLLWFIDQQSKKSKKTDDKKKEELQSSKAEQLAEAVEKLKSID